MDAEMLDPQVEAFNLLDDVELPYYGQDYDDGFQNQPESTEQNDFFHDPYFSQNNPLLCNEDFLHPKLNLNSQLCSAADITKDSDGGFIEQKENWTPVDTTKEDLDPNPVAYSQPEENEIISQPILFQGEQLQKRRVKHEESAECKVVSAWPFWTSKRIRVATPDNMEKEAYKDGPFETTMGEFGTQVVTGIADACFELKPYNLLYLTNGKGDDTSERGLDPPPGIEIIDIQSDSEGSECAHEDRSLGYSSGAYDANKERMEAILQSDMPCLLEPQKLQEKDSKLGQSEKIFGKYAVKHEELGECEIIKVWPFRPSKSSRIHQACAPAQLSDVKSEPVPACKASQHGNWKFGTWSPTDTCPELKPHELHHLERRLDGQVGIEVIDSGSDSEDLEHGNGSFLRATDESKPQGNINLGAAFISPIQKILQPVYQSQTYEDVDSENLEHGNSSLATVESRPEKSGAATSPSGNANGAENVQSACPSKTYEDLNKERIEAILQNTIAGDEEANLGDDQITIKLLKHQRIALAWMEKSELRLDCQGGLLADDQGLGKTISAIALILKARPPKYLGYNVEESRSTLIVCPKSLLRQWERELKEKVAPPVKLSVFIYHGDKKRIKSIKLCKHDIVLTTYGTIRSELQKPSEEDGKNQSPRLKGTLSSIWWFRIILDEAQLIRNAYTKKSRACWGLNAQRRWCLSGTPIQNQIDDLYSYFRFLRYYPYDERGVFKNEIKRRIQKNPAMGYKRLQIILDTVMLRRTKATMIDDKPIVMLPSRVVKLEQLDFDAEERQFYDELEFQSCEKFKEYERKNILKQNYMNVLVLLLRLRQACNHPILVINSLAKTMEGGHQELAEKSFALYELADICRESNETCAICKELAEGPKMARCGHIVCTECLHEMAVGNHADIFCPSRRCNAKLEIEAIYDLNNYCSQTVGSMLKKFKDCMPSSKIKSIIARLKALPVAKGHTDANLKEKALVFSQWTSMLDLLEPELQKENILFKRMDGSMTIQERDASVSEFSSDPKVTVLLLSLGAASLGLNLISACHVLLIDPWWNPAVEDQAIDRTHRVGQKNDVLVSRFTIKKTVEDRILQLQEKKRKIVEMAFGEEGGRSQGRRNKLSLADLRFLFTVQ